jgi:polysaccharide chain length determinant protein (PEP-CTERM system associated)
MTRVPADEIILDSREGGFPLSEYTRILRWYWMQIACLTIVGGAVAIGVAVGLPGKYRSSATILVQQQQVPVDFVRPTVTSFADERISTITQRVMTASVLGPMIERHGLYQEHRSRETLADLVDRMRQDIEVKTIDAQISDRISGNRVGTTVAFTIGFEAAEPRQAQAVVEEVVAIYLEENERARQRSVAATTLFLGEEAHRIAQQIKEIEGRLAEFKGLHQSSMPEAVDVTLQLSGRTDLELLSTQNRITTVNYRIASLKRQLALMPRNLESEATGAAETLARLRAELAGMRERYSATHPDIQRLERAIAATKAAADEERRGGEGRPPSNPGFVALAEELENANAELASLQWLQDELSAKRRTYEAQLLQAPEIEREYRDLTRDYENAQMRYREIRAKEMQAEIAEELEADQKAERFAVVEPPSLPDAPSSPRRKVIALLGFGMALGGSVALAWLRDLLDSTIKSPLDLVRKACVPVLMPIPRIQTRIGRAKAWLAGIACLFAAVAAGAAGFAGSYGLLAPVLAYRLM